MGTIGEILKAKGQEMVIGAAELVVQGIKENLEQGMEVDGSGTPMNSGLRPTRPLSQFRITTKRALGYQRPELPRVATGAMYESVNYETKQGEAVVAMAGQGDAAEVQNDGSKGPWVNEYNEQINRPTPPRPFWGVTQSTQDEIQQFVDAKGDQMVAEMNNVVLPAINLSV